MLKPALAKKGSRALALGVINTHALAPSSRMDPGHTGLENNDIMELLILLALRFVSRFRDQRDHSLDIASLQPSCVSAPVASGATSTTLRGKHSPTGGPRYVLHISSDQHGNRVPSRCWGHTKARLHPA